MKPGAILKAGSVGDSVRSLFASRSSDNAAQPNDVETASAAFARNAALERQLQTVLGEKQEMQRRIEQLKIGTDQRIAQARAAGRDEARKEMKDAEATRLGMLSKQMEAVSADLALRMDSTENLAALLAHDALSHMFGEISEYADLVTRMIGEKVSRIGALNVVEICVSQKDFGQDDLAQIRPADSIKITAIDGVSSGHFSLHLKLGQVDVSLEEEYRHILDHLHDCARLEPAQ